MRQTRQEPDSSKKNDRRLLRIAGSVFVLAACVAVGLYTQRNAARSQTANPQYRGHEAPRLSEEKKAEYVERAKFLRAKLEPWARAHQTEIKRMMSAGPNDVAALDAVWQSVPFLPEKIGITPQELMPTDDPLTGVGFGWAAYSKTYDHSHEADSNANPDSKAMDQKVKGMASARLQNHFKERRDIALMVTASGHTWTYVWASGRVTQATDVSFDEYEAKARLRAAQHRILRVSDIEGPQIEMAPPYDFLTSSTAS